ncbi:MAG: LysR family transcriptional regulator [Pseudophaeobacter sp. bin_em_oilr2.035]|uniref:LysR family transcriptional regulator n=2 Tax=Phaeobacter gallaeciensis TaxID=60890 RepID=A0ABD4XFI5_9RHOB|nr:MULTISPECIES: LysR family transcriptional regulator [Phaeobacter]MDF1774154.1 LysR family transcriptional regulator [Pseudophaeobacter sp. bin_em_oilr2.035]MDE4062936.1 LysR family transcriptional regulator [Phaeobacter gallaeciensis]MDE4125957.1 LysR family transcriptional regulator [Phaeobacter gallaeciensis]MDE4130421.1 LysR family transcriptional regulator [Phaeobacter gallaeciensis]MDE4147009.1 LysR family transcriptional regulator [Phaeobacter gallaeciensis]
MESMESDGRFAPERIARELDWNLLRTFVVLAESHSITEAAQQLRLKQPSVSAALKKLEDRIGRKLIDRSPGHYQLTDAGRLLYREALDINGSILRLSTLMRELTDEVQGHVKIVMASHVVCPLFDEVLADFHLAHPKATLSIDVRTSAAAIAEVAAKRASFALCLVRDHNPKLEYRRLYREFFGLFCGPRHPLFGRKDLKLSDLAGHSSVSFETDRLHDVLKPVTVMRAQAELGDKVTGLSSHLEEVHRMIVAGVGIGPLPVHVAARDVRDGQLWQVPPYDDLPAIDVHVVWNRHAAKNRAEELLIDGLLEAIAATPIEQRTYR